MAGGLVLFGAYQTGFVANNVASVITLAANNHIRHVRLTGTTTYTAYPTGVVGDDDTFLGVQATFPAAAPGVPSQANAGLWVTGYWGRARINATEENFYAGGGAIPNRRVYWELDFDWSLDAGQTGAIYVGHQAAFVDVNHSLPLVGATMTAWGFTT